MQVSYPKDSLEAKIANTIYTFDGQTKTHIIYYIENQQHVEIFNQRLTVAKNQK